MWPLTSALTIFISKQKSVFISLHCIKLKIDTIFLALSKISINALPSASLVVILNKSQVKKSVFLQANRFLAYAHFF